MYKVSIGISGYPLNKLGLRLRWWAKFIVGMSAISAGLFILAIAIYEPYTSGGFFTYVPIWVFVWFVQCKEGLIWNGLIELICFSSIKFIPLFKQRWAYIGLRVLLVGMAILSMHVIMWSRFNDYVNITRIIMTYGGFIILPWMVYAVIHLWSACNDHFEEQSTNAKILICWGWIKKN